MKRLELDTSKKDVERILQGLDDLKKDIEGIVKSYNGIHRLVSRRLKKLHDVDNLLRGTCEVCGLEFRKRKSSNVILHLCSKHYWRDFKRRKKEEKKNDKIKVLFYDGYREKQKSKKGLKFLEGSDYYLSKNDKDFFRCSEMKATLKKEECAKRQKMALESSNGKYGNLGMCLSCGQGESIKGSLEGRELECGRL